ncbi:MAG: M20/M25/M40 family metallo-hydrolase [Rhodothalassiaceae bacterium]
MKRMLFAAAFVLGAAPLSAQELPEAAVADLPPALLATARALREAGLADERGYRLIESLTTEVGPRLAGSEAEARARDWAVKTMRALGFANVHVEPFTLPGWRRGVERAAVLGAHAQPLAITALGGSVATPEGGLEAEIVRFSDLYEIEALPAGALAGKIAFIDLRNYRAQNGDGYRNTVYVRSNGPAAAAEKGAVALLIRSVGTDSHRLPHTGQTRYREGVPRIPAAALSAPDADQLDRLLALGPVRVRLALTPTLFDDAPSGNVVGEIPGRLHPEEIVIAGGHLDSWDLGTGAIDDAAGVGITLAAAKLIAETAGPPARTIRVVLWGSEEPGLYGARAYAKAHEAEIASHVIGAESDFGAGRIWSFATRVGREDRPWTNAIHRLLRPLGIGRGDNEAGGGPDVSPLARAGMPVVELRQDGSRYFDLHHTADDTFDKVARAAVQQNIAAWAVLLWLTAESDVDFRPAKANPAAHAP